MFETIELDAHCKFLVGALPEEVAVCQSQFDALWAMHPKEFHEIRMPGGLVKTPRWQQAYGADYHYTGRVNKALPIPQLLEPIYNWVRDTVDERLNGILVNWYDARLGHYIGKHRDSTKKLVDGAPIVTISLGEERVFRLRPWRRQGYRDFGAPAGTVFVTPFETNLRWTHEVPHYEKYTGFRISITMRAFESGFVLE